MLPGGRTGTENLGASDIVREQCVRFAGTDGKFVAAVCAAPSVLASLGLVKRATVHPDFKDHMGSAEVLDESVVVDGNIVTGQGLGATIPFALKLAEIMVSREKAEQISSAICYR